MSLGRRTGGPFFQQHLFHGGDEAAGAFIELEDRFFKIGGGAFFEEPCFVGLRQAAEHHDGNAGSLRVRSQRAQNLRPGEFWQHHVEHDQVGFVLNCETKTFFSISRSQNLIAGAGKGAFIGDAEKAAVINQKDFHAGLRDGFRDKYRQRRKGLERTGLLRSPDQDDTTPARYRVKLRSYDHANATEL